MIDGNGLPLAVLTTKANVADIDSALPTIDALVIGTKHRRPKRLRADKGYDSAEFRSELRKRGIKSAVDHRDFANRHMPSQLWDDRAERRYAPCRWKVERSIAVLDQQRRLDYLWEHTRAQYEGFVSVALIRCYVKKLSRCRG